MVHYGRGKYFTKGFTNNEFCENLVFSKLGK